MKNVIEKSSDKVSTLVSEYSLSPGKVGQPVGHPVLTEHENGLEALKFLWAAMEVSGNGNGRRFQIVFSDGATVPFDAAYIRIFGESPVYRDNKATFYPRMPPGFRQAKI